VAAVRRDAVIALVREMIADGTLKPGALVSGAALARKTGFCKPTCHAALHALLADGTLARASGNLLRVTPAAPDTPREALSEALAAARRAAGLTQPELAGRTGFSVTAVGHAETGRLWQSRGFWEAAGTVLGDGGALLLMYDEHKAAALAGPPSPPPPALPASVAIAPGRVTVTWADGTKTVARPPRWQERAQTRKPGE